MIVKESCRYVRSYSELEGLQRAHTLCYSARRTETGIVLELAPENFPRAMRLMKYLYENGVGAEQWLDVLSDNGQQFVKLPTLKTTQTAQIAEPGCRFVAFV